MNENIIPIDDEYKSKLFNWFYKNLNESFKTAEIEEQLKYAYDFAFVAHRAQRRKTTKEPFIVHPVSVALIVANEIGLGVISVVAALLHDVVEDTHYTLETIIDRFGSDVADIVAGLTKITNVYNAKSNVQAETFKKMLLSIPHDPRVVFIKLADRLHNMRTMEGMPQGTIQIKAGENLYVYVPVAYKLGLYDIKNELEDSSFKYAQPQQYESVVKSVEALRKIKDPITQDFKNELMRILVKTRLTCKIVTEKKSYYYVSQGLSAGMPIEDINYEAVRVVFQESDSDSRENTVGEHFKLYSSIIVNFPEREGYRNDYVVKPKKNGFQALVFQVNYRGHWIEVQIITEDNDMVSHKGYSPRKPKRQGIAMLAETLSELNSEANISQNAEELLGRFHDLATSEQKTIFVFTPKGDIQELPLDATVIDFAYGVHTDVGNHCIGAYVGSKFVPLDYKLKTADQVTIFSSASARPQQAWLHFVKTDRAKIKIAAYFHRNSTNVAVRPLEEGRKIFHNYMRTHTSIIPDVILLKELIKHFHLLNGDDLYKRIANQELDMKDVYEAAANLRKVIRAGKQEMADSVAQNGELPMLHPENYKVDSKVPFRIDKTIHFIASGCCNPLCGDDAVTFLDDDNILYVHRRDCVYAQNHTATDGKHTAQVEWGDDLEPMLTTIQLLGTDRQGIIRDVSLLIDSWRVNIQSIEISSRDKIFSGIIKMYIKNTTLLEKLSLQLGQISNIVSVNRLTPNNNKDWRL
ncbi:MAG: bifunctional (p)ppGpp synthetase/guanosine-3',5'-bis(diphosphate) 3'-pyrophosphohydrolase [Bacteroidales bacterium]|nr:bifunctional (p)ppGpp synthetase/guanosine-3',5'-bis(diphosphate) 3'-pyrophosphohydrolase [Bacteroidales bacterium]